VYGLLDGFWIDELDLLPTYTHNSELQKIAAPTLIYTLYSSPLHTPTHWYSQSSLVVSCQRIYNSLTLTAAHKVFSQPNSFLAISSQSFDCHLQRLSILMITIKSLLQTLLLITSQHGSRRKHRLLTGPLFYRGVFTSPLHRNGIFYCCMLVRCTGNVYLAVA
jgi:hypothetical protein